MRSIKTVRTTLARLGLQQTTKVRDQDPELAALGFEPIAPNGNRTTNDQVNMLRDAVGD